MATRGLSSPAGDISRLANAAASGDWAVRGFGRRVGGLRLGISSPPPAPQTWVDLKTTTPFSHRVLPSPSLVADTKDDRSVDQERVGGTAPRTIRSHVHPFALLLGCIYLVYHLKVV